MQALYAMVQVGLWGTQVYTNITIHLLIKCILEKEGEMEIKLDWEQWKLLKELLRVAEMLEIKSTTGSARLDDQKTQIDIHETITITIPD